MQNQLEFTQKIFYKCSLYTLNFYNNLANKHFRRLRVFLKMHTSVYKQAVIVAPYRKKRVLHFRDYFILHRERPTPNHAGFFESVFFTLEPFVRVIASRSFLRGSLKRNWMWFTAAVWSGGTRCDQGWPSWVRSDKMWSELTRYDQRWPGRSTGLTRHGVDENELQL